MDIDINSNGQEKGMSPELSSLKLKNWTWVLYPIFAALFIYFSVVYYLTSGDLGLSKLISKQEQTDEEKKVVNELKAKVDFLKSVNKDEDTEKLKKLLVAMPASKKVWYLITAVQKSASVSGLLVKKYSGEVGDVKEATESASVSGAVKNQPAPESNLVLKVEYEPTSFESLHTNIANIVKMMPLVKVVKANYGLEKLTVVYEGAWASWPKPVVDPKELIPKYDESINSVLQKITELEDLTILATPEAEVIEASESGLF